MAAIDTRPYFVDGRGLTKAAGLIQIRDYAVENGVASLLANWKDVQENLKKLKDGFFGLVSGADDLNYFGATVQSSIHLSPPERTKSEQTLRRRLAVAGVLVQTLHDEPNFGRTKLAKLFYLADVHEGLDLQTEYHREPAGPLDQRALYNDSIGIEALAQKYHLFYSERKGRMERYKLFSDNVALDKFAARHLGAKAEKIKAIATSFKGLTTEQSEIVATLFACWNDFLIQKRSPTDEEIVFELLHRWHPKKSRFSQPGLMKALAWMRKQGMVPRGRGKITIAKVVH